MPAQQRWGAEQWDDGYKVLVPGIEQVFIESNLLCHVYRE